MFPFFWQAHRSSHSPTWKHANLLPVPPSFLPSLFSSVAHHLSAEAPSADRHPCQRPGRSAERAAEVPQRPQQESDGTARCGRRGCECGWEAVSLRQPAVGEEGKPKRSENEPSLPSAQQRLGSLAARTPRAELSSPEEVSSSPSFAPSAGVSILSFSFQSFYVS